MQVLKLLIVLILVSSPCFAAPKFPVLTGRVVDNANMISSAGKAVLTQKLAEYEQKAGEQVVIATVPSLQNNTIEDYGYQLGRYWGIGEKGKNNGLILLVAPKERKVRIEVGYGLEGKMTDVIASQIIHDIILPDFRNGQMEKGVSDGTEAILTVLNGGELPEARSQSAHNNSGNLNWFPFILIGFFIVMAIVQFVIHGIVYLYYRLIGKPLPKRFTSSRLGGSSGWGYVLGSGFSGAGGSFGGGFSGGGGSFGGGGASGGW